jgi:hypothetical protein
VLELLIHLIFVQPNHETFTEQEKSEAIASLYRAGEFWDVPVHILSTDTYTTSVDVYSRPLNEWHTVEANQQEITIYIVDHSSSGALLFGYGGYAQDYYRLAVVVNGNGTDARIAHELGHVLYGLPDWYTMPNKCNAPDIMCDAESAFRANIKGCNTLAFLGTPCYTLSLPVIVAPQYPIANSAKIT